MQMLDGPQPPPAESGEYDYRLEVARTIVDNAQAAGAPIEFDTAHSQVSAVRDAWVLPLIPTPAIGEPDASSDISPAAFFGVAEGLDLMMTHADPQTKREAAVFVTELTTALPSAREPAPKATILGAVLGIEFPLESSVASQLVERYPLSDDGTPQAKRIAANIIAGRARSFNPPNTSPQATPDWGW